MNMHTTTTQNNTTNASSASEHAAGFPSAECEQLNPVDDIADYVTTYARQNPGTAALWCFGVGFIVGWKLKPW